MKTLLRGRVESASISLSIVCRKDKSVSFVACCRTLRMWESLGDVTFIIYVHRYIPNVVSERVLISSGNPLKKVEIFVLSVFKIQ